MVPVVDGRSQQACVDVEAHQSVQSGWCLPLGTPLLLFLSPAATVFLTSSRLRGVASKGHVFSGQPALAPSCKTSSARSAAERELLLEGVGVS